MVHDPAAAEDPDLQAVLDALDDPDCRAIVRQLDDPMTASELSEATDVPLSTVYRKMDLLSEASLVTELTEVRSDGHHTTRYGVAFEQVSFELTDDRDLSVAIDRPPESTDERLADMWSEVRKET